MNAALPQLPVQAVAAFVRDAMASAPAGVAQTLAKTPVLLDVREAWELQTARLALPGVRSVHIPLHSLPARLHELQRTQPILALCHHGARSLQCVAYLRSQGFEAVYNIAGGIDAWSREVDASVPRY